MNHSDSEELIADYALDDSLSDRLGLDEFAEELAYLVTTTRTPANIALYAAWGSGKSSVANLLRKKLATRSRTRFVRYDAFKYAETPLRRHFLSQVAQGLEETDPIYTQGLYQNKQTTEIKLPGWRLLKLFGAFLLIIGLIVATLLLIYGLVHHHGPEFAVKLLKENFVELFASLGVVSAVISALVALSIKPLVTNVETTAPSSEEEFEERFRSLIAAQKHTLVVIFIDELDRCSPREVVTTLETMRTFLEIERCVFIVAADQAVLEQALTERARQSTPDNVNNPHYSAGSEYLDKIFQYQFSLPVRTPRRLSQFAIDLVQEKHGIWDEIRKEHVVSVLIPTHVSSPRRVKILLNAFVIAYRIAKRRVQASAIDGPIEGRAAELAKLVCLRHEFPLFARDLAMDPRLPDLVLTCVNDGSFKEDEVIKDHVKERARMYARRELPVAEILSDSPSTAETNGTDSGVEEHTDESTSDTNSDRPPFGNSARDAHASQLLDYLHKTASIQTPQDDLVFLEGAGVLYGFDSAFAREIETDAVNGRSRRLTSTILSLSHDKIGPALQLIGKAARDAAPGEEGSNAVSAILLLLQRTPSSVLTGIADDLADSVSTHLKSHALRPEDLPGALKLGIESEREVGIDLLDSVLQRDECVQDSELAAAITLSAPALVAKGFEYQYLGDAAIVTIQGGDVEQLIDEFSSLQDEEVLDIFQSVDEYIDTHVDDSSKDDGTPETRYANLIGRLTQFIDGFSERERDQSVHGAISFLLSLNTREARTAVESRLGVITPITESSIADKFLDAIPNRALSRWPEWVRCVDLEGLQASRRKKCAENMFKAAITRTRDLRNNFSDEHFRGAIQASIKVQNEEHIEVPTSTIQDNLEPPSSTLELQQYERLLECAKVLLQEHVIPVDEILNDIVVTFEANLATDLGDPETIRSFTEYHERGLPEWAEWTSVELASELAQAVLSCEWIESPLRQELALRVCGSPTGDGTTTVALPIAQDELEKLVRNYPRDFEKAVGLWLDHMNPDVESARPVIEKYAYQSIGRSLGDGLGTYVDRLPSSSRFYLIERILGEAKDSVPSRKFMSAVQFGRDCEQKVADKLVSVFSSVSNREERENIIELWKSLDLHHDSARAKLIKGILTPLATQGKQALDLVRKNIQLAVPPPRGTKTELVDTIKDNARVHGMTTKVEKALVGAKLMKKSKNWWKKGTDSK